MFIGRSWVAREPQVGCPWSAHALSGGCPRVVHEVSTGQPTGRPWNVRAESIGVSDLLCFWMGIAYYGGP